MTEQYMCKTAWFAIIRITVDEETLMCVSFLKSKLFGLVDKGIALAKGSIYAANTKVQRGQPCCEP